VNEVVGVSACLGCEGKGELVFVIDTANHNDQQSFISSQNFIKDIIRRIANCILPDAVRLGFIYRTESDDQQFGLVGFQNADDAVTAIGEVIIITIDDDDRPTLPGQTL